MIKVEFDSHELLNDILSKDGHYIDLIGCNEYTFWYLVRQAGIRSFLPVINTQCFINSGSIKNLESFGIHQDSNLEKLLFNAKKFFNIRTVQYDVNKGSIKAFIQNGVQANQFIYTLYDSYYDTFLEKIDNHDFHGHPIVGYDDKQQIYYSIFEGEHEVKYDDLKRMLEYCYEVSKTYINRYFYLDSADLSKDCLVDIESIKQEIIQDCVKVIDDWTQEIECFNTYIDEIKEIFHMANDRKLDFVLKQRLLFNTMMEGLHGNFIFKLQLFQEIFSKDMTSFVSKFRKNRKKCVMIANMYRKAAILVEEYPDDFDEVINRLIHNLKKCFITDSLLLLNEFKKILETEVQGGI